MAPSVSYSITVRLEMAGRIPSVFHPDVTSSVAVRDAATRNPDRADHAE